MKRKTSLIMITSSIFLQQITQSAPASASDAIRFREIFSEIASKRYTPEDIKTFVYLPTPELAALEHADAGWPRTEQDIHSILEAQSPSQLFSQSFPIPLVTGIRKQFLATPASPATIVFFPGVTGEFADTRPFEEIVSRKSSWLSGTFRRALQVPSNRADSRDTAYSLAHLNQVSYPLDVLVNAASIDDDLGKPLVNLIYLRPLRGSLESLGSMPTHSETYLRRIDKTMRILHSDPNAAPSATKRIIFSGYSRGAAQALDTLSAAHINRSRNPQQHPWLTDVEAMVSLSGSIWGSAVVDGIETNPNFIDHVIEQADLLAHNLETPDASMGFWKRQILKTRNTIRWVKFFRNLRHFEAPETPPHDELTREQIAAGPLAPHPVLGMARNITFEMFRLHRPFSDYFGNIRRFQVLMQSMRSGMGQLASATRNEWWQNAELPLNIKYYSLLATMGDPTIDHEWFLTKNPLAYESRSQDFAINRASYYDLWQLTGLRINDGGVSADEALFLPARIARLNPNLASFPSRLLGIVQANHWGIVMPSTIPSRMGKQTLRSPFPRDLLILAIGKSVTEQTN